MLINEIILRRTTPVVINSYNQPSYLKNLIEKFKNNEFKNIIILDNNSKNPELIDYYDYLLRNDQNVMVIYYNNNNGPRHFHLKYIYKLLNTNTHLYSDPDIDFDVLANDFMTQLNEYSEKFKLFKVGCALEIPSAELLANNLSFTAAHLDNKIFTIPEWESQFWLHELEDDIYNAPIDTTLHLFNDKYFYNPDNYITGIRIGKPGFIVKHLPWYQTNIMPTNELNIYLNTSLHTSTIKKFTV